MYFSLKELEVRKVRFDVDFPVEEIDFLDRNVRQSGPLHAEGIAELLSGTLGEIRIQGHLNVEMEASCDRCLEPVRFSMDAPFDLFYRPTTFGDVPHEREIDEGESEIAFYEGSGIELGDILREHIFLSLPMRQICSEACRGICPQCGQNRNLGSCTCVEELSDDRWAALGRLRSGLRAGSGR